jgi:phosphohistidine phosphatase
VAVQVILIRHADAVDETLTLRDPHRNLSERGRANARALGDRLCWHDCAPTAVWTSPLVRAIQTAELVVGRYESDCAIEVIPALAPDGDPRAVVAAIRALPPRTVLLVIGHEPSLSGIGGLLVGDPEFAALATAQAARIVDGKLRWRFAHDAEAPSPAT